MPSVLIDANVLIYAFDQNEPQRQEFALQVLRTLKESASGRLSVQEGVRFVNPFARDFDLDEWRQTLSQ